MPSSRFYCGNSLNACCVMCLSAVLIRTRSSADADKPVFRGQSRSPKMVPFNMLGMVSY